MELLDKLRDGAVSFLHTNHREPTFVVMNKITFGHILIEIPIGFLHIKADIPETSSITIDSMKSVISEDLKDGQFLFGIE